MMSRHPRSGATAVRLALLVAATMIALGPTAAHGSMEQVVRADDGIVAAGTVTQAAYPDGTEREVWMMLVVPRGVTLSTGGGDVDLSRAWALVRETIVSDPSGRLTPGTTVCSTLANPQRWGGGAHTPAGDRWTGTTFEFACEGGTPYDAYRVRWEPAQSWVLVANPVTAAWMGGHVIRWSSSSAQGTVAARATANQQSKVTLCGVRAGRSECFTGAGQVVPSVDGMVITATGG